MKFHEVTWRGESGEEKEDAWRGESGEEKESRGEVTSKRAKKHIFIEFCPFYSGIEPVLEARRARRAKKHAPCPRNREK